MSDSKQDSEQKIVSKKHVARLEKEKKLSKILVISLVGIIVAIVGLIIYGILAKTVFLAMKPVAKVNAEKITVEQFQRRVRYERLTLVQSYENYLLSGYAEYLQNYMLNMQNELDNYITMGSTTLDDMILESLIISRANELGITVSEDEVSKSIQENFGFFKNGTPTPTATSEYRPTSTYSALQLELLATATQTPEATLTPTVEVTSSEEGTPSDQTAAPDESAEIPAETATPTITEIPATEEAPNESPTATQIPPTATPYTEEGFNNLYSTVMANLETQTKFGDAEFRNYIRVVLYSQKLYEYISKDVPTEQEMVWARHILVKTEEEANSILEQLNAGVDFSSLAAQYSLDTSNNYNSGDLGWMFKGQMVTDFENAAWSLQIGETSQPVKTSFGYHIIQVLGHEVRQMSPDELKTAKSTVYQQYLEELKASSDVTKYDRWASVVPTDPSIPQEYRIQSQ